MNQFFENIKIENFKSLRHVELTDCKRINLFIGKPNVGKSNILEALSLFSIAHNSSPIRTRFNNSFKSYIRYDSERELFFNGRIEASSAINIQSNLINCNLTFQPNEGIQMHIYGDGFDTTTTIELDERVGVPSMKNSQPYSRTFKKVKKYIFDLNRQGKNSNIRNGFTLPFLMPPFGNNLMRIISDNEELTKDTIEFFKRYELDVVFDEASNTMKLMKLKQEENDITRIFLLPYSSMADTLQRVIFYKTAIASNKDSILLFEEPEAHAFPPYIVHITQEMIWSKDNQFFLTTHSPFVLNDFLENAREDLAVYLVDWKDGETTVKRLTDNDLHEIYQYGVDLFTNLETFI